MSHKRKVASSSMHFRPTEVLFSPTADCNLSCEHCATPKSSKRLPVNIAGSFLLQCKRAGIKRVSFTGGEPFLRPDFLCCITKLAVQEGLLFGRIMTNGVWYKNVRELESALVKLHEAGYDGDICVSVDAFHVQNIKKVAIFIKLATSIWRRPDMVSVVWVGGSREKETNMKLKKLLSGLKGLPIKTARIALSPIGVAGGIKDPWGNKWFKEDYCKGPGNALFVLPDGDVKPCCGYATDQAGLTIGNIKRSSAKKIIDNARHNDFVRSVFTIGLSGIRKRLERLGVLFPDKTENHCFFCHHLLTKIPKAALRKAVTGLRFVVIGIVLSAVFTSLSFADATIMKKSKDYCGINVKTIRTLSIPRWYHEGLYVDGDSIWVANGREGNIWVVNMKSGEIVSEIESPAGFTEAVVKTAGGKYLATDWDDKKLYEVVFDGGKTVSKKEVFDFTPSHPAGIVPVGDRLLVILWTRGMGTKFEILELDKDFKETERVLIRDIQEPAHMAWDGKYLWVTGWYNRRVYRVDLKSWDITASFRAPFNKVTGIAWDGKYLWVTGTYADLYQLSVD